jgi:hypothetical protein
MVGLDPEAGAIQDRQEELRHRIRLRRVVSKGLQDAGGGLIVAALGWCRHATRPAV